LKSDFVTARHLRGERHGFKRDQSRALRCIQSCQAGGDENPVFPSQGRQIGDGAKRGQVQLRPQIHRRGFRQALLAHSLEQRVNELESQADRTKFTECAAQLRIHQRHRRRGWLGNLVMVQHHDINAFFPKPGCHLDGSGAAIHRQ
jgi:hypothetical protein